MRTKEELTLELAHIRTNLKNDIEKLEKLAESMDIYIRTEEAQEFSKRLRNIYPVLNLSRSNFYLYNGLDSIARDVADCLNYPEKNLLSHLSFQSIDLKKKTFTTNGDQKYYFYYLQYFGFNVGIEKEIDLVKSFQNGKHIYKFKKDEDFEKFVKIVYWQSEDTTKVLQSITQEDSEDFRKFMDNKKAWINPYNYIWTLRENKGLEVNTEHLNYNLLFDYLENGKMYF